LGIFLFHTAIATLALLVDFGETGDTVNGEYQFARGDVSREAIDFLADLVVASVKGLATGSLEKVALAYGVKDGVQIERKDVKSGYTLFLLYRNDGLWIVFKVPVKVTKDAHS
jgi:hypothetical protein